MRERDENAYIRFFALWFAAGMTLGVLLLLTASHMGMKEGNSVRLFQAEAFLGRKISAKACFSYLLKVRLAPAFAGLLFGLTAIGAYLPLLPFGHMVFCVASFSRLPICRTEWQVFYSFFWLFFRRFSSTLPRYF